MKKSRKAIALLLALVMLITMLPVAAFATEAPAPATNVVEAVTEVEVVEGGQQVAIEMPNFDEADELARIKAREDRSLFRALPIIPPWDPSQLKADIVFDLTTNSGAHDFLWDQIFEAEGGAFDLVVSYIENGEPKTQTVQITAPGETVLLPQMPIYNADGSKIDYQFKVTFPDDVAYKVTVDTWQTSGAYDSLTNPKKYILKSSFTRLISTEIAAVWYTNNDVNPELTGTYDTGAGATIPTFKIPTTNLSTILRASFARDIDPETGQVVFKDINGDGIIDQPMVPEDNVLGVGDGTGDGGVWVEVDNVVNGKVTADGKDYFVVVDFNEVTGGVITIREALTVTFNKGDATTMTPAGTDDKVVVEVGHSEVVQGIPVAEKDGATFVGWKDDSGTIVDLTKPVTTSLNLSPVFNDDVIPDPEDPDNPVIPPAGYVTVEFTTDTTKGTLQGTKKFYVNPEADPIVTYAQITEPTILPETGYKVADIKWDPNFAATDTITAAATHAAQYVKLDDVIPDP
ncbi:MAG: hypothetical protein Q4G61_08040, partial [Tissierellia bacterium]|nr:hypothetical protein [Tissierellia bacterium]